MRRKALVVGIIILAIMVVGCNEYGEQAESVTESQFVKEDYQTGIDSIKKGDWDKAAIMLAALSVRKYKDSPVLYAYVNVEKELIEGDFRMMMRYLEEISDGYQGDLADIVLKRKREILDNKDKLEEEMKEQTEIKAKERALEAKERIRANALLEGVGFNWYQSSRSHVTAEGEIKNISDTPLRNVMAVVTYKTKEGDFITYDSALIEYNPIMPDQISPFRVITQYNPLMDAACLEFQFLSGEKILCYFE